MRYLPALLCVCLCGCATAELSPTSKTKVAEGELIRLETENQETLVDFMIESLMSKASGVMHDLKIKVRNIDGEKVQRKFGEGSQVFALAPGAHHLVVECTHEITRGKTVDSQSRVDDLKLELRKGYRYVINSREDGDSCVVAVSENKL